MTWDFGSLTYTSSRTLPITRENTICFGCMIPRITHINTETYIYIYIYIHTHKREIEKPE